MRALRLLALLAAGCGGAGDAPDARVLSSSPASLSTAADDLDDLTIRVRYSDGDGDLGGGRAEVTDCRAAGIVTVLALPPLASDEAVREGVPIEGELDLLVADVGLVAPGAVPAGCPGPPAPGTAVFCVVLVDAAGHRGAGSCTGAVGVE